MLSKKDLIEINKHFASGNIINAGSLDYGVKTMARSRNWLRAAAVFTRAILLDHIFEDGNKRTAAAVIILLMEMHHIAYNPEEISKALIKILKENQTTIKEIEKAIKHGVL